MRYITEETLEHIAVGAAVLGTGGGGDPYIGKLMAREAIRKHGPVRLITLAELADDALVVPVSGMGSPTVSIEKLPSEVEIVTPLLKMQEVLQQKVDVIIPIEIGGINSMMPIAAAAMLGLPILDADSMGRAFPEAQMVTFYLDGYETSPITLCDEKGNSAVLYPKDALWAERLARAMTIEMGGSCSITDYHLTGAQIKHSAVPDTMTLAENIGQILQDKTLSAKQAVQTLLDRLSGFRLFEGKITDMKRELSDGFTRGQATFTGINGYSGDYTVLFQNEHLIAKKGNTPLCMTPDLIAVLDVETGLPITTERMRYGARVIVVAFPCYEKWRTEKGIETVGPRYFGYDEDYVPIEQLRAEVTHEL